MYVFFSRKAEPKSYWRTLTDTLTLKKKINGFSPRTMQNILISFQEIKCLKLI